MLKSFVCFSLRRYDLVGVTVHTGTADGGHYYSFIKERNSLNGQQDRWFLFNDAEVKIFDPSQIAAECFGGEMIVRKKRNKHCGPVAVYVLFVYPAEQNLRSGNRKVFGL